MTEARVGYQYRCKITDSTGNVVYSQSAEILSATQTWDFTYDANGMRTSRTDGTTTYNYVYNGTQLSQMTVDGETLNFCYDANGTPLYIRWNGTRYFYVTNLQGDVTAIVSVGGYPLVEYTYDAWGNILTITGSRADTLGKLNPLRYRGYVYDVETELYYLQSRYYDPEVGRFLNADNLISTGQGLLGNNMFVYCLNNPVCRKDIPGTTSVEIKNDDGNPADNDKDIAGGKTGNNGPNGNSNSVPNGQGGGIRGSGSNSSSYNYSANTVFKSQTGTGQAPPNNPPGTVYTQLSGDGGNTITSQTLYNEYNMPAFRIDYRGHGHGVITGPHIHLFSVYNGPNGTFLNKGPILEWR